MVVGQGEEEGQYLQMDNSSTAGYSKFTKGAGTDQNTAAPPQPQGYQTIESLTSKDKRPEYSEATMGQTGYIGLSDLRQKHII